MNWFEGENVLVSLSKFYTNRAYPKAYFYSVNGID